MLFKNKLIGIITDIEYNSKRLDTIQTHIHLFGFKDELIKMVKETDPNIAIGFSKAVIIPSNQEFNDLSNDILN